MGGNDTRRSGKLKVAAFIAAVDLAGLLCLPWLPISDLFRDAWTLLLLLVLALISGARPIRIPAIRTEVSASDPFVFTTIAYLGGLPAVAVAALAVLGAGIIRRPSPGPDKILFNLGSMVLSTAGASWVFVALGGVVGAGLTRAVIPLAAAATVYFLVNTILVTSVIIIDRGGKFFRIWSRSGLWTGVSTYTGLTLAACLLLILNAIGPLGLGLGIPPCWLLITFYRTHKDRLEAQQKRIDRVVDDNLRLEEKVQERTVELQRALQRIEEANNGLRVANRDLANANRAKNVFLANMSHELRTPLNAIIGFSSLLRQGVPGDLNEEQNDFIGDIHNSGVHLLSLINDILDLSKIEAGKMVLHRKRIEPCDAIQGAASMLKVQADKKSISLTADCRLDGTLLNVDPGVFRQVLVNLLSNAVKFTPEGGEVHLDVRREDLDLLVEVRDTGIGIAPEDKERVFEEFYQVDATYSRKHQGTGLGLALVRRMVELHGGTIEIDSVPDRGTTISLAFPETLVEAESPRPAEKEGTGPGPDFTGSRVLVVEDNLVNLKLARNLLKSRGFSVLEATTGEEGLDVAIREIPDVVLMDIQLPGADGLEITRRIKDHPDTAAIPVLALTAHAGDEDKRRAMEAGCVGYVTKPIHLNRLAAALEAVLEAAREGVGPRTTDRSNPPSASGRGAAIA